MCFDARVPDHERRQFSSLIGQQLVAISTVAVALFARLNETDTGSSFRDLRIQEAPRGRAPDSSLDSGPRREEAIAQIQGKGGFVTYHLTAPERIDRVYLASTVLDSDTLAKLVTLRELHVLSFNNTALADRDLPHLDSLVHLRELHLNGSRITDDGIAYVAKRHSLVLLTLNDTSITDRAVVHLATMKSLRKLHLYHTKLTNDAVARLRRALPLCRIFYGPLK